MAHIQLRKETPASNDEKVIREFGALYLPPGAREVIFAAEDDPYYYEVYAGTHSIAIQRGDCAFSISHDRKSALLTRGPFQLESPSFATLVRGFSPENRTSTITNRTVLPYVNGCSTKQIFPPDRPGDPTFQMLNIPPYSSEQAHHIHSTVRCVYILSGEGRSVVGMDKKTVSSPLTPGTICVLQRMCPHHFETSDSNLVALPVHVWSSTPGVENQHPMFNGTFRLT